MPRSGFEMKTHALLATTLVSLLVLGGISDAQQFQDKAEYDAYMALYNEQDTATKVGLGEAFVSEYPESEAAPIAYQILVATHFAARNWRGVVDVTRRFQDASSDVSPDTRSFIYRRAMAAAQQTQNPTEIIAYGEEILQLDRNDLGALLTLPPVILDNLPDFGGARERSLSRAFELANRARLQAQTAYPVETGDPQTNLERAQVFSSIHMSLGGVRYLREDYERAANEYLTVLGYDSQNPFVYLRLGLAYQFQAARSSVLLQEAGGAERDASAEPPPEVTALEQEVLGTTDQAIEALAKAVALGGQAADLARVELEKLYPNRNQQTLEGEPPTEDPLEGLDELIEEKRAALSEAADQ